MKKTLMLLPLIWVCASCTPPEPQPQPIVITNIVQVSPTVEKGTNWTILYYADADDYQLEGDILYDIRQMKLGISDEVGLNLIVLVDRYDGASIDSLTFGENFTDTRLYRILKGRVERLEGGSSFPEITLTSSYEANMADAQTLKKFVRFGKENYPANYYALILANHGEGPRSGGSKNVLKTKSFCWDATSPNSDDRIFLAELTDVLTADESVHLFGLDICNMASVEVAYQIRHDNGGFQADYLLACAPEQFGGWQYREILSRIRQTNGDNGEDDSTFGGLELYYSPELLTPNILGGIIVEERKDHCDSLYADQTLALINLSNIAPIKLALDEFAVYLSTNSNDSVLFQQIRGSANNPLSLYYFNPNSDWDWILAPFFDIYDLFKRLSVSTQANSTLTNFATNLMAKIEDAVVYSYGGIAYSAFEAGKNGLYLFFPDGSRLYEGFPHWAYQWWYNALDLTHYTNAYGKMTWCSDGAVSNNSSVENWFELLDFWYDISNDNSVDNRNGYIY